MSPQAMLAPEPAATEPRSAASTALDPERLRQDFPFFLGERHGIYLDSASTTQKPQVVLDRMSWFYAQQNANVHRGVHALAAEATAAYEDARARVAAFVGAPDPRGVVFTKNFTEAANLVAYAWARRRLGPGDEILATLLEHHSNLVPWQLAARDTGATLRFAGVTPEGELRLAPGDINARTRLVAVTGMSNALGTFVDLDPIIREAHAVGALVLVDGAQLVPHRPVDFARLGADFLGFSAHKLLGPMGVGVLVARPELLEEMEPFLAGGEMIREVTLAGSTFNDPPWKFEAGTPPVAEALGLHAALGYLDAIGFDRIQAHERRLFRYGWERLAAVPGVVLYGPGTPDRQGAIFSFNLKEPGSDALLHPSDVGMILDQAGVAVRVGHHCAQPLLGRLGVAATCRASLYLYNTPWELDRLAEALEKTRRFLGRR